MFSFWQDWMDAAALGLEAQGVIARRLVKIAAGGPAADAECRRMVEEKFAAAAAAQAAAVGALAVGMSMDAAARLALAPLRRRVRANHPRLSRGEAFESPRSHHYPVFRFQCRNAGKSSDGGIGGYCRPSGMNGTSRHESAVPSLRMLKARTIVVIQ